MMVTSAERSAIGGGAMRNLPETLPQGKPLNSARKALIRMLAGVGVAEFLREAQERIVELEVGRDERN